MTMTSYKQPNKNPRGRKRAINDRERLTEDLNFGLLLTIRN